MKLSEKFEQWVRDRHLKECAQCQKEGKARLTDTYLVAVVLFKAFEGGLNERR